MDYETAVRQTTRGLMILMLALTSGVIMFGAVAFVLGPIVEPDGQEGLQFLRLIAAGLPLLELAMAAQIWMSMSKRMDAADGWEQRIPILRGRTIVMAAMFEGPALLAVVVLLLLGPSWHIVPAILLFLLAIGALLPTPSRVRQAIGNADGTRTDKYS